MQPCVKSVQNYLTLKQNRKPLILSICLGILDNVLKSHIRSQNYEDFVILENILEIDLNFNLSLSYSNEYPYQNIYTSYSLLDSSKNILKSEMIEYQLFDKKYGFPLGSGIFQDFVLDSLVIESISLDKNSEYIFIVKHSMREDKLNGISRIALDIKKN